MIDVYVLLWFHKVVNASLSVGLDNVLRNAQPIANSDAKASA